MEIIDFLQCATTLPVSDNILYLALCVMNISRNVVIALSKKITWHVDDRAILLLGYFGRVPASLVNVFKGVFLGDALYFNCF